MTANGHPDMIGIGALNIDYIATREKVLELDAEITTELENRFEHGTERPVDEEEINRTLQEMGIRSFEAHLGGSAFNTVNALSSLQLPLKLGYVGVAGGAAWAHGPSFKTWFRDRKVDDRFVRYRPNGYAGACVSFIHDGERSMLTCPGVNVETGDAIRKSFAALANYVAKCKFVHVTSFFDDETPQYLTKLLQEAKRLNHWLRVSFDPGHHWVRERVKDIRLILPHTDYLFLNDREFKDLGHYLPGRSDEKVAQSIFEACQPATVILVLKRYDHVTLFTRWGTRVLAHRYSNIVLAPEQIEDSTGAGDVFAAGFIATITTPGLELRHGVQLGLRLVREKLVTAGSGAFRRFPAIMEAFLNEASAETRSEDVVAQAIADKPAAVYLSSSNGRLAETLQEHLENLGLEVLTCPCQMPDGKNRIDYLAEYLNRCSFALLAFDMSSRDQDYKRARDSFAHEFGLFQGRLGFSRVAALVADGSESISATGLQRIRFNLEEMTGSLRQLKLILTREGLIDDPDQAAEDSHAVEFVDDGPKFSSDYRSVRWLGETHTFTEKQATVVKTLYEHWRAGIPDVSHDALLDAADSDGSRLVDLFKRNQKAYRAMITQGARRGTARLNLPPR
ncbi:MAG TPA: PfkB family carbohydrate kinase [Pirellulaceae bacterium]|jgi:sugar/nucleoside kinase (ribokinase family)